MVVAFIFIEAKLFSGKPIFRCGVVPFLLMLVVLSSSFGCAIGLVSGMATEAVIVLSIFSFINCCGYGFRLKLYRVKL